MEEEEEEEPRWMMMLHDATLGLRTALMFSKI